MAAMERDDVARGVVIPDLRHLTVVEQVVLTRHEHGARTAIFAANIPSHTGGPDVESPNRARPAVPPLPGWDMRSDRHPPPHSCR
jgi:hypothetical protein